jgi:hypothetical protein
LSRLVAVAPWSLEMPFFLFSFLSSLCFCSPIYQLVSLPMDLFGWGSLLAICEAGCISVYRQLCSVPSASFRLSVSGLVSVKRAGYVSASEAGQVMSCLSANHKPGTTTLPCLFLCLPSSTTTKTKFDPHLSLQLFLPSPLEQPPRPPTSNLTFQPLSLLC